MEFMGDIEGDITHEFHHTLHDVAEIISATVSLGPLREFVKNLGEKLTRTNVIMRLERRHESIEIVKEISTVNDNGRDLTNDNSGDTKHVGFLFQVGELLRDTTILHSSCECLQSSRCLLYSILVVLGSEILHSFREIRFRDRNVSFTLLKILKCESELIQKTLRELTNPLCTSRTVDTSCHVGKILSECFVVLRVPITRGL